MKSIIYSSSFAKICVMIIALCLFSLSYSQEIDTGLYKVDVNTSLVVREAPSSQAPKIGSVKKGDLLEVQSCVDGWAEIKYDGQKGYVSARYLVACTPSGECIIPGINDNLFDSQVYMFLYKKMPFVILGLGILLLLLARTPLSGVLLVLMGVSELLFVAGCMAPGHSSMVWFGDPGEVGWLYAILGFALLIGVLGFQFAAFRGLMSEVFSGCLWSLLGYPLMLVLGLSIASLMLSLKLWFIVLGGIGLLWLIVAMKNRLGIVEALRPTLLLSLTCGGFLAMVWESAGLLIGGFLILLLIGAVANGGDHASARKVSQNLSQVPASGISQETEGGDRVIYDNSGRPTFLSRNPTTGEWQDEEGHFWEVEDDGYSRRL